MADGNGTRPACRRNLRFDGRLGLLRVTGEGAMSKRSCAVREGETGVLAGARKTSGEGVHCEVADWGWKGEGFSRNGEGSDWKEVRIWCCGIVRVIGERGSSPGS